MDPVVETRSGKLRGQMSSGVTAFKGDPFVAAPFGRNRMRPPQAAAAYALEFGPKSPQVPYPPGIAEALA